MSDGTRVRFEEYTGEDGKQKLRKKVIEYAEATIPQSNTKTPIKTSNSGGNEIKQMSGNAVTDSDTITGYSAVDAGVNNKKISEAAVSFLALGDVASGLMKNEQSSNNGGHSYITEEVKNYIEEKEKKEKIAAAHENYENMKAQKPENQEEFNEARKKSEELKEALRKKQEKDKNAKKMQHAGAPSSAIAEFKNSNTQTSSNDNQANSNSRSNQNNRQGGQNPAPTTAAPSSTPLTTEDRIQGMTRAGAPSSAIAGFRGSNSSRSNHA